MKWNILYIVVKNSSLIILRHSMPELIALNNMFQNRPGILSLKEQMQFLQRTLSYPKTKDVLPL